MTQRGHLREHSHLLLWLMRCTDLLVSLLFCAAGYYYVFDDRPLPDHYQVAVIFSIFVVISVFQLYDLYRTWRGEDFLREFSALLLAWTTVFAILAFLSVITKTSASFSRAWLLIWYTGGAIGLSATRFALRSSLRYFRSKGFNLRHIVLLGYGDTGDAVLARVLKSQETGFNVAGYYTNQASDFTTAGPLEDGLAFLRENQVDQVWLAIPLSESERIAQLLDELKFTTADIRLIPDLFSLRLINHSISQVAGMSVINLSVTPMDGVNRWLKALEDKLLSLLILLLVSPLLLLITLAVKLSSPGPVIYKQQRLSWNGREFDMYKFRTMPVNAESESGPVWASREQERATAVGKLLRRSSLDELPQFWNVLKGDMSIVGPRPERKVFVEQFRDEIPRYMQKHMVKAGITGWAQVNGWRGDTDLRQRIEHDLYYIENWSLWLDLKVILLTIFRGFVHRNAY